MNRKSNRKNSRRSGRRKQKTSKRNIGFQRSIGSSDTQFVKLKYCTINTFNPGFSFYEYIYRLNSLFNIDIGNTTGNPSGSPYWYNLYEKSRVISSTIVCSILNLRIDDGIIMTVLPCNESGGVSGIIDAIALPYVRWEGISNQNGQSKMYKLRSHMGVTKLWGEKITDDNFSQDVSTQPINQSYWCLNFGSADGTINLSFNLVVEITYNIMFFKRQSYDNNLRKAILHKPPASEEFKIE